MFTMLLSLGQLSFSAVWIVARLRRNYRVETVMMGNSGETVSYRVETVMMGNSGETVSCRVETVMMGNSGETSS